jgi:hypothetical protein
MSKKKKPAKKGNPYITLNAEMNKQTWNEIKKHIKPTFTVQKWVAKVIMEAGSKL